MTTSVFLSYDGMTDPLGQSQVLPYLEGLAASGPQNPYRFGREKHEFDRIGDVVGARIQKSAPHLASNSISQATPPILSSLYEARNNGNAPVRKIAASETVEILHARNLFMAIVAKRTNISGARLSLIHAASGRRAGGGGIWNKGQFHFRIDFSVFETSGTRFVGTLILLLCLPTPPKKKF